MDKLTELLTKLVARLKIQIPIPVGIVFYYMPFDATLVLLMNNAKGCLPDPNFPKQFSSGFKLLKYWLVVLKPQHVWNILFWTDQNNGKTIFGSIEISSETAKLR